MSQRSESRRRKASKITEKKNQSRDEGGLEKGGYHGDGEIISYICRYHTNHCLSNQMV